MSEQSDKTIVRNKKQFSVKNLKQRFDEIQSKSSEKSQNETHFFPTIKLEDVLLKLLSNKDSNESLMPTFREYAKFVDVMFYCWQKLAIILQANQPTDLNDSFILNCLAVLESIPVPKHLKILERTAHNGRSIKIVQTDAVFCKNPGDKKFVFKMQTLLQYINKVWSIISVWKFTKTSLKQLLIVLLDVVFPHLKDKLRTTDLLMDSIDYGGAIGVSGLQGFYLLYQHENLECPEIYRKLYSYFNLNIFEANYKVRLFRLADLFLSSTHLQYSLVAAFAKRLSRLSLKATPHDVKLICLFITNLMIRHPQLIELMHSKSDAELKSDPYSFEEKDPLKSNAIRSSFWEIESLKSHILPNASLSAQFIDEKLPNVEHDLNPFLNKNFNNIFNNELKRKQSEAILSHKRLKSSEDFDNEYVSKLWSTSSIHS